MTELTARQRFEQGITTGQIIKVHARADTYDIVSIRLATGEVLHNVKLSVLSISDDDIVTHEYPEKGGDSCQ